MTREQITEGLRRWAADRRRLTDLWLHLDGIGGAGGDVAMADEYRHEADLLEAAAAMLAADAREGRDG